MKDATALSIEVRDRSRSVRDIVDGALARCDADRHNAVTAVLRDRARARADFLDDRLRQGGEIGPLAGVPFLVKNLIDVAEVVTLGGSTMRAHDQPAGSDAACVQQLEAAGAVLVGTTNMDEFAYGFTTENTHYGATTNPLDSQMIAGGSSGGSGAAVAAGLVPIALGTDTNGSIRVPAAVCGVVGHRPTFERYPLEGVMYFARSLDTVGPIAMTVRDLRLVFDVLADDATRPSEGLRTGILGGYFLEGGDDGASRAVELAAGAVGATQEIEFAGAAIARSAAMVVTASEGAEEHYEEIRDRSDEFDPMTRGRFLAGSHVTATQYLAAKRVQREYIDEVEAAFGDLDVLLAPGLPCAPTPIGQVHAAIGGQMQRIAPNLGLYTQPISFGHLPVVLISIDVGEKFPRGVQVVARRGRDEDALDVAARIEASLGGAR